MLRVYINVRETGRDNKTMDNPETQEILGTRHRQKTKYKKATTKTQRRKLKKNSNTITTKTGLSCLFFFTFDDENF